jgi:sugar lactone lactonase YvrE
VLGQNYSIYTFAGGVLPNNVSATSVPLPYVPGIAVDKAGNSYFAATSWNAVFRVDAATGQLTRFAGSGIEGYSGDNGPAISAQLYQPFGVAVDASGSVYIADTWNNVIRKVSNGVITTIAGNGTNGYSGDNGPATKAEMEQPLAVAVDASGNVYIADEGNNVIRKVSSGTIATIAGNGTKGYSGDNGPATSAELTWPCGVGVDASGNVYVADTYNNVVRKVSNGTITPFAGNGTGGYAGDNGPAANAQLSLPYGVGVDASGNVYIADYGNGGIRKVSNGTITTIAGNGTQGYSGDNGPATSAELKWPRGVAVDTSGNVYIADTGNYVVRKVSNGVIATLAGGASGIFGDNGPASGALLIQPYGVAVDAAGNLYVADTDNYAVRKISNGVISTIAGNGREGYSGDNGPATSAELGPSQSLAVDTSGNVYIADADDQVIRKVSNGVITTFAGNGSRGYSGDDGPATSAMLLFPNGVAADASGNVYIADSGNRVIRKVSNGVITTFAGNGSQGYSGDHGPAASAQLNSPDGVAVDASGTVYIADSGNYAIRKVSNGVITTIAGNGSYGYSGDNGAATSAELGFPAAVAVDPAGDVYIADTDNDVIRRISNGVIATIAGFDSVGYSGDNGPATSATLRWPWGVAVDASGKVYIADTDNNVIRVLVPTLSAQAASLTAKSASGSLQVDVPAGVHWTASSNDSWITITGGSSGTGSGTVSFSVQADTGAARTGTLTIDGLTFTIEQESSSTTGLSLAGSMAQIASAGGWDTSLTLVNLGTAAGQARLNFFANDGSTPLLPFTFPQQSSQGAMLGSTFAETLGAGATLVLDTTGPATQAATVGSSQLLTSGNIGGFAIFKYTPTGQEAVVPLETRNAGSYVLAFDNTGPLGTGLAVANLAASAANIRVVLRDDTGAQIGTGSISLRGQGHNSFMLTDATNGFPITANKRGTVEFDTPQGGQISVLGLRANGAALTSLPLLANVGATGGTMAHVASGGGWQTIFTLVNTGTTSATATLNFFGDDGSALSLPLSFPQTGTAATESSLSQAIPAGATLVIVTQGLNSGASATGSAQLTTNGQVSGFAIFQNTAAGQEAVVPLEVGSAKSYMLAFDNTSSLATGIALSNGSGQAAAVSATLRDATGATLTTTTINLPASGHKSEMLTDLFAAAANIRGTLEFDTPTGGHIAALGIRATPAGAFTTIPVMTM